MKKIEELLLEGEGLYDMSFFNQAKLKFLEANLLEKEHPDKFLKCRISRNLGRVEFRLGNNESAKNYWNDALKNSKKNNYDKLTILLKNHLGALMAIIGKTNDAKKLFDEGKRLAIKIQYRDGLAKILNSYGAFIDFSSMDYEIGLKKFDEAKEIFHKLGDKKSLAITYDLIGTNKLYLELIDEGLIDLSEALSLSREIKDKIRESSILRHMGYGKYLKKEYNEALQFYNASYEILKKFDNNIGKIRTLLKRSELYYELNELDKFKDDIFNTFHFSRDLDYLIGMADSLQKIGNYYYKNKNNFLLARRLLSDSLSIYQKIIINSEGKINNENYKSTLKDLPNLIKEITKMIDNKEILPNGERKYISEESKIICISTQNKDQFKSISGDLKSNVLELTDKISKRSLISPKNIKDLNLFLEEVYREEWNDYLLFNFFEKMNELSQKEVLIMDRLHFVMENRDLSLFIIFRIIEREIRINFCEPLKRYWKNNLMSKYINYNKLKKEDKDTFNIIKEYVFKNKKPTLGQIKYIIGFLINNYDFGFENLFKLSNLERLYQTMTYKIRIGNKKYDLYYVRNEIAHGDNTYLIDLINSDDTLINDFRIHLTLIKPCILKEILEIN